MKFNTNIGQHPNMAEMRNHSPAIGEWQMRCTNNIELYPVCAFLTTRPSRNFKLRRIFRRFAANEFWLSDVSLLRRWSTSTKLLLFLQMHESQTERSGTLLFFRITFFSYCSVVQCRLRKFARKKVRYIALELNTNYAYILPIPIETQHSLCPAKSEKC